MRSLLFIIFVLAVGFLVYTQIIQPPSEELQEVRTLRKEFDLAKNQCVRALKYTSGTGIDTVGGIEMAKARMMKVKNDLADLRGRLQDEKARQRAASLDLRIDNFMKRNNLD